MIFSAVLDANVLYPFSIRDTLLRLAELELYRPLWSGRILEETREALLEHGVRVDRAEAPAMTNDPGDRHVLACAVAADSELIVTSNLAHFPSEACESVGVEARHPDDFLLDLLDLAPEGVRATLEEQAADLHPPWPLDELLGALERVGVPQFVAAIRAQGR